MPIYAPTLIQHSDQYALTAPQLNYDETQTEAAHYYLDISIDMLWRLLPDADPWTEVYDDDGHDRDGFLFGLPESFSDILPDESAAWSSIERFGPVARHPDTIEGKNRLMSWLALRHRIIATWNRRFDDVIKISEIAAKMVNGQDAPMSRSRAILLYQIPEGEYYFARRQVHGPGGYE